MVGGGTRQQVTVSRWHGRGRAPGVVSVRTRGLAPGAVGACGRAVLPLAER